jgi:hypothetical protein
MDASVLKFPKTSYCPLKQTFAHFLPAAQMYVAVQVRANGRKEREIA